MPHDDGAGAWVWGKVGGRCEAAESARASVTSWNVSSQAALAAPSVIAAPLRDPQNQNHGGLPWGTWTAK